MCRFCRRRYPGKITSFRSSTMSMTVARFGSGQCPRWLILPLVLYVSMICPVISGSSPCVERRWPCEGPAQFAGPLKSTSPRLADAPSIQLTSSGYTEKLRHVDRSRRHWRGFDRRCRTLDSGNAVEHVDSQPAHGSGDNQERQAAASYNHGDDDQSDREQNHFQLGDPPQPAAALRNRGPFALAKNADRLEAGSCRVGEAKAG